MCFFGGETGRGEGLRDYVCVRVCASVDAVEGRDRVIYVMHYYVRLYITVMFRVYRFEPHTCIVIEGFGALEIHLVVVVVVVVFK